jgi:outer membrane protein assembly factor BamB
MDRLSRLSVKALLLSTILLMCFLAGCGYQGTTSSGAQGQQNQSTKIPQKSCPTEGTVKNMGANQVAYTVSWDAVATDADNNQGKSTLHVSALDVASGKLLWQKAPAKISSMYQSSLQEVVDGVLYIASSSSQNVIVIAVNTQDGHAIWQREEKWGGVSTMAICAGKIYLNTNSSGVKALQASNGNVQWSYTEKNGFLLNLVPTTKAVYALVLQMKAPASMYWFAIALETDNGKVLWQKSYGEQPELKLSLVANGQAVYVIKQTPSNPTGLISKVQALDAKSGKVIWTANMPPNMEQIYILKADNIIYLNSQNPVAQNPSLLVALNASNGKQLWQRKHSYNQITALNGQGLFGYEGYAFTDNSQTKKQLCSLDSTTGKERWCVDSLQPSQFSLSTTRDTVIVEEELQPGPLTLIQNIYGVSKQDGKILWKLPWKSSSPSVQTLTLVTVVEGQGFTSLQA